MSTRQPFIHENRDLISKIESETSCIGFIARLIGITILLPFAFVAYIIAWITIALIGTIIFIGFPVAAIFLDTIRWVATNYNNNSTTNNEYLTSRLRKASMIIINIFEIMADLKRSEFNTNTNSNIISA
jgi:hypothetical protein